MGKEHRETKAFVVGPDILETNEIPSIVVWGNNLPEAWENSVLATLEYGCSIPTQYDQDIDPESRDATSMIVVVKPMAEPRIHKALPCGFEDLEVYRQEVVDGIHDSWVGEGGWSYSYHDRLFNWPGIGSWEKITGFNSVDFELTNINQINQLMVQLSDAPHTRRAQAITWVPWIDGTHHEPPCLQRIWCRIIKSGKNNLLEMNTHWRSRDAFKAAFMNMFALTDLQNKMATDLSEMTGRLIEPGRYVDISDSYHVYGSYIRKGEIDKFLKNIKSRDFSKRTVRSDNPVIQNSFARVRSNNLLQE